MTKRLVSAVVVLTFVILTAAPESLACHRGRRTVVRNSSYNTGGYRAAGYGNGYYSPYRSAGVAGERYYNNGERWNSGSTGRAVLTVAAPAALGAGVGAILGGGKGAGVGALLGGGGGALYYLIRNNHRRF